MSAVYNKKLEFLQPSWWTGVTFRIKFYNAYRIARTSETTSLSSQRWEDKNLIRHLDGPSVKTMSKRITTYGIIFAINPFLRRRPKSFLHRLYPLAWISLPHGFSLLLGITTVDIRKLHFSRMTNEPKKEKTSKVHYRTAHGHCILLLWNTQNAEIWHLVILLRPTCDV